MKINHKIGDKVIAISSSKDDPRIQKRIKGQVYIIKEVMYCSRCDTQLVNLGEESKKGNLLCGCGSSQYNKDKKWTYSKHFIPMTEEYLKYMESVEQYEICAVIKKELDKLEKVT